jgi:hypothetical protein
MFDLVNGELFYLHSSLNIYIYIYIYIIYSIYRTLTSLYGKRRKMAEVMVIAGLKWAPEI